MYDALMKEIEELQAECDGSSALSTQIPTSTLDEMEQERECQRAVTNELKRYIEDGPLTLNESKDFDICRWWQVSILFVVALIQNLTAF